jgi:hypothetical protein
MATGPNRGKEVAEKYHCFYCLTELAEAPMTGGAYYNCVGEDKTLASKIWWMAELPTLRPSTFCDAAFLWRGCVVGDIFMYNKSNPGLALYEQILQGEKKESQDGEEEET